jgi:hypothetical protein
VRRRLIAVRTGLGLVLVGVALALAAVFTGGGAGTGNAAPAESTTSSHSAANPAGRESPTTTPGTTRVGRSTGTTPATKSARNSGSGRSSGTGEGAAAPTTNPASASTPAQSLVAPSGFGPVLRAAWVAANPGGVGVTTADVQSTYPGSVYYAGQPSIGQYWSLSRFLPSAMAQARSGTQRGKALLAVFGTDAVFVKTPGHGWAYIGSFAVGGCPADVPATVLHVWGICTSTGS